MTQAIFYARYSPRPSGGATCESIGTQMSRLEAWATSLEIPVASSYYFDRAKSGKDDNRPGLQAALEHACRAKGILSVYKLDRLARNTVDAILISRRLEAAKADLVSVNERIDTTTSMGRFFFRFMASMAELEREQIAERTSDAMISHQDNGRRMTRPDRVRYGTMIDPSNPARTIENPEELATIEVAREIFSESGNLRKTCRELDALGHRRRAGKPWTGSHAILKGILERATAKYS